MGQHALLWANGEVSSQEIQQIASQNYDIVIAADGGLYNALQWGYTPQFVVGDLDSTADFQKDKYPDIQWIHRPSQELNDLEKSLQFCQSKKITDITLLGITGKRLDHTLSNLSVLCRYDQQFRFTILTPFAQIFIVRHKFQYTGTPGQLISLLPFGAAEGIVTRGLAYPLNHEPLILGQREGLSNTIAKNPVEIEISSGILLVFVLYPEKD